MTTLVDVKKAVENATSYFMSVMTVNDVRLEEIEIADDERFWNVTLSGLVPSAKTAPPGVADVQLPLSSLATLFKGDYERVYKVFTVDAATGSVRSMKIRKV